MSILIEIILWLCFLVPGLIYSAWRISKRHDVCPSCGGADLVPLGSPRGKELAASAEYSAPSDVYRPPSAAAQGAGRSLGRLVGRMLGR